MSNIGKQIWTEMPHEEKREERERDEIFIGGLEGPWEWSVTVLRAGVFWLERKVMWRYNDLYVTAWEMYMYLLNFEWLLYLDTVFYTIRSLMRLVFLFESYFSGLEHSSVNHRRCKG